MKKNRLTELIKESNLTKKEIAKKLNVNPVTITRWERGDNPIPSDKAQSLSAIFDVNVNYLLGNVDRSFRPSKDSNAFIELINALKPQIEDIKKIQEIAENNDISPYIEDFLSSEIYNSFDKQLHYLHVLLDSKKSYNAKEKEARSELRKSLEDTIDLMYQIKLTIPK
ncbi:helix-turn-helix domain-containing protein [Streptococcus pluranimalium]